MHTDTEYRGTLYDVDERWFKFTRVTGLPRSAFTNQFGRGAKLLAIAVAAWAVAAVILAVWY